MKFYYEAGKLNEKWILNYCKGDWSKCVRYHLEESGQYHPDNMLPDGSINNNIK